MHHSCLHTSLSLLGIYNCNPDHKMTITGDVQGQQWVGTKTNSAWSDLLLKRVQSHGGFFLSPLLTNLTPTIIIARNREVQFLSPPLQLESIRPGQGGETDRKPAVKNPSWGKGDRIREAVAPHCGSAACFGPHNQGSCCVCSSPCESLNHLYPDDKFPSA
jgi:hypothetical protein